MNWSAFVWVIFIGELLVFSRVSISFIDGWLSSAQVLKLGYVSGSFLQRGEEWVMALLVTPWVAYLMGEYQFAYLSGIGILIVAFAFWILFSSFVYSRSRVEQPSVYYHNGQATLACDIHTIHLALATWIIVMAYIPGISTITSMGIVITSIVTVIWGVSWGVVLK